MIYLVMRILKGIMGDASRMMPIAVPIIFLIIGAVIAGIGFLVE